MMRCALIVLAAVLAASSDCPPVTPKQDFNITEFVRATWYVQEQQANAYQQESDLYCVAATYNEEGKKVPFFKRPAITVYNYANKDKVNGALSNPKKRVLCGRQPDKDEPAKLSVAPCFLPNIFAGPYWVLGAGPSNDNYEWMVVSGGQPTEKYDDGCTTKKDSINNSGLWILARQQVIKDEHLATAKSILVDKGYTLSQLKKVPQEGCKYDGAFIKDNAHSKGDASNSEADTPSYFF